MGIVFDATGNEAMTEEPKAVELSRLRLIAEGWSANYESFVSYRCRVRLRQGECSTVEEAHGKGPVRNVVEANATLVVDGEKICYVRQSNEKAKIDPASGTSSLGLPPVAFLFNGERALDVNYFAVGATLRQAESWGERGIDFTTWNEAGSGQVGDKGHFGPNLAETISLGRSELELHPPAPVRGVLATRIDKLWNGSVTSWFVDEERGFIPIEVTKVLANGKIFRKVFVTEIRSVAKERWFPTRCVAVWLRGDEEAGSHTVREIVVTDLEVDIQPRPEEFQLPLPQATLVYKEGTPTSAFTIPESRSVDLEHLDTLEEITTQVASRRAREASGGLLRGEAAMWLLIGVVIFAASIGIFIFVRDRKSSGK